MPPTHLFVYGTLDPHHAPPAIRPVVQRLRFVADASVRGGLYDLGDYPGLILDPAAGFVHGRLFRLPDDDGNTLAEFDRYEGIHRAPPDGSLYLRVTSTARLPDGTSCDAWLYVYNQPIRPEQRLAANRWTRP